MGWAIGLPQTLVGIDEATATSVVGVSGGSVYPATLGLLGAVAVVIGLALVALPPVLKRLMGGVR